MEQPKIVSRFIRASLRGMTVAPISLEEVTDLSLYVERLEIDNRRLRGRLEEIELSARAFVGYNIDIKNTWSAAYNALQNIAKDARETLGDWTGIT